MATAFLCATPMTSYRGTAFSCRKIACELNVYWSVSVVT